MFEHLPIINQASIEAFAEQEIVEIAAEAPKLLSKLAENNPRLARAVEGSAQVAAENIGQDYDAAVAECLIAILIPLRLVDRALEAQRLEKWI